jgi:pyruvate dehydrogenase E2 component (dihydrolipoamide acetyltransferase)
MSEFRMPSLGADMVQGRILEWRVHPGDRVHRGDIVALVDTEKAAIEVEIFEDGVVEEILVPEGSRVPVGTILARLRSDGAVPPAPAPEAPELAHRNAAQDVASPSVVTPAAPPVEAPPAPPRELIRPRASPAARALAAELGLDLTSIVGTGPEGALIRADVERHGAAIRTTPGSEVEPSDEVLHRPRISPLAERVAAELQVDLSRVKGSGPGGAITRQDVERVADVGAPAIPEPTPGKELDSERRLGIRHAIAAAVSRSKREIPHYYLSTRIDLSRAMQWLKVENQNRPVRERLLPAAMLLRAVVLALREYPDLNGFWVDDGFREAVDVHLGVAVALRGGGLMAPAILSANRKSLGELMHALSDLVQRTRSGGLRGSELTGPTITVTNLGDRGVEAVFGVIYPPQVAIVGFGRISEQPWASSGMLGIRPVVTATLAGDHRASDGHRGGLFLATIERLLQSPEVL